MTTSRNDFEAPDNPSSSIDSASAAPGAGDGGGNRSDSSTDQPAQSATDRPGLLARAASALRPRRRAKASSNSAKAASDDAVVAGVLSPTGLLPLSLVTEGTVVPL